MTGSDRRDLSLGYRVRWRLRYLALSVFGPAQLGTDDPLERLRREREERAAATRRERGSHRPAA